MFVLIPQPPTSSPSRGPDSLENVGSSLLGEWGQLELTGDGEEMDLSSASFLSALCGGLDGVGRFLLPSPSHLGSELRHSYGSLAIACLGSRTVSYTHIAAPWAALGDTCAIAEEEARTALSSLFASSNLRAAGRPNRL